MKKSAALMSELEDSEGMKKIDLDESLAELRRNLEQMIELQTFIAEVRWHSYHEHIKAGFSPEQALVLCQKMLLS